MGFINCFLKGVGDIYGGYEFWFVFWSKRIIVGKIGFFVMVLEREIFNRGI